MKRILLALIVVAVPCLSLAAPADSTTSTRANSLRDGAKALQFLFNGGLSSGSVVFKNHFGARNALRLGFSGRFSSSEEELEVVDVGQGDYESDHASLRVDLTYLRYVGPMKSACFYLGAGPFLELAEQTRVRSENDFDSGIYYDSYDDEATTVGLLGTIGAEWFIVESLSLAFEYEISAGYRWYEREEVYERPGEPANMRNWEGHSWSMDANRYGSIGLGIYF